MGIPAPLPWPASAQVIPLKKHARMRAAVIGEYGEMRLTRWEDGEEHVTLRVFCERDHCTQCECDPDHVIILDTHQAHALRALLNELQEPGD